jgi:antitoxin component YwqK of YwqJK toxin-antitoxin module
MTWKTKNNIFHSDSYWEYIDDNGVAKPHYLLLRYDLQGRLLQESEMYRGVMWGKTTTYFRFNAHCLSESNQVVCSRQHYVDGELHGRALEYHDNGVIWCISEYKHGVLDGDYYTYYDDGRRKRVGRWRNGIQVGEWTEYDKHGNITLRRNMDKEVAGRRFCIIV